MAKYSEEARNLLPYLLPLLERSLRGGAGGPGGLTIIGAGLSPHALDSSYHTGLLKWAQLNKAGSSLAQIASRPHSALTGIGPNDHHSQVHLVTGGDHTITGAPFQLVGATATNTLGLLTPSMSPGANASILRTDTDGSLYLDTNLLYVDAPNNRIGVNRAPGAAALDVLSSANADHTLRVKQKSGQTGRLWRVEDTSGNELIVLTSVGDLQSGMPGFTSGLTGWQINHLGNAEFNNIWARGELHATVFVKDEIHATGGTLLVATAGKLYSDALIDSTTVDSLDLELVTDGGVADGVLTLETDTGDITLSVVDIYNFIEIDDPPSGPGFYFQVDDVVRSKTEVPTGVTDFWLEIRSAEQLDGYSSYGVIKRSGTDGVLPAGAAVVSYGVPGDGRILLTSDLNYAPYIDVFTVGPDVWTGAAGAIIPHVRLGRLDGVGVTAVSGIEQYGMIAGTDLSDANSPYIVASNLQLRLHKVDLTLNDGSNDTGELTATGNLTLGSNIGVDAGKSFQVKTTGVDAGDVIMGHIAGSYVHFDESAEILTVNASLVLGGLVGNSLVVGEDGYLKSMGMLDFDSLDAGYDSGFFLGWDTDAYKFFVGNVDSHLLWDGASFGFNLLNSLNINLVGANTLAILFSKTGVSSASLSYGVSSSPELVYSDNIRAQRLIAAGDRMRIDTSFTPASAAAAGTKGDVAYDTNFEYRCVATDTWKRVALSTW